MYQQQKIVLAKQVQLLRDQIQKKQRGDGDGDGDRDGDGVKTSLDDIDSLP